jgi:diacylglycerol O-acyltransferase
VIAALKVPSAPGRGTLNSYADRMEFGITACRRALPHIQGLLDYFEQGLSALEGAAR